MMNQHVGFVESILFQNAWPVAVSPVVVECVSFICLLLQLSKSFFTDTDTFDVSNATIVKYKDSYSVICEFVEGSRCQGCKIDIIEARTTTQIVTLSVPRFNDASSVTQCLNTLQLPQGEYHVFVSDIESDGTYSDTGKVLAFSMYNSEQSSRLLLAIANDN